MSEPVKAIESNKSAGNADSQGKKPKKELTVEDRLKRIEARQRAILIISVIGLLLMIFNCVFLFILYNTINNFVQQIQPMLDVLSKVDWVSVSNTIDSMQEVFANVDFSKLDFSKINVDDWNKGLESLNRAVEIVQNIGDKLQPLLDFFRN